MPEYKKSAKKKSKKGGTSNIIRLFLFWAVLFAAGSYLFNYLTGGSALEEERSITEVMAYANDGQLEEIVVRGNELHVTPKDGVDLPKIYARKEGTGTLAEQGFEEAINQGKVRVKVEERIDIWGSIFDIAIVVVPSLLLVGFLVYMMRQAQSMNNQSVGFGKAKARLYGNEKKRVLFTDVAGNEAAKQDLSEIVDFLKNTKSLAQKSLAVFCWLASPVLVRL